MASIANLFCSFPWLWELKAITERCEISDIPFMKTNKGNMTVIKNKQDYEKLFQMLQNGETYENLKRDPTSKKKKNFNKISKFFNCIRSHKANASPLKSSTCTKVIYGQKFTNVIFYYALLCNLSVPHIMSCLAKILTIVWNHCREQRISCM